MIFLLMLIWPIAEIAIALAVIRDFGFANAFFLWLIPTILGFGLLRTSGVRLTLGTARAMSEGRPPAMAAIDGGLVGLAGLLFLLPGYVSDVVGFLLLIPLVRRWVAVRLLKKVVIKTAGQAPFGARRKTGGDARGSEDVIDVDAVVMDEESQHVRDVYEAEPRRLPKPDDIKN